MAEAPAAGVDQNQGVEMRRPFFNFLAVAGAVLLAAIGVSAHAQGSNVFGAFTGLMGASVHNVTTDTSGGSVEASGARENETEQSEAPKTNPAPEPAEAPDQDNDNQGDDNDNQGDDNNNNDNSDEGSGD